MDRLRSVGETHFFRHPAQFEHLKKFAEASKPLRIWSAGCANGAEIYSAVLSLAHKNLAHFQFSASDFNPAAIQAARTGRFSAWHLRGCTQPIRERFFRSVGDEWQLDSDVLARVEFFQHDLVDGPEVPSQDVIFCRNVLIYMDPPTMAGVVDRLYRWLAPGGVLYLGYSEAVLAGDHPGLELIDTALAAYRHKNLQLATLPVPVLLPPIPLEPLRIVPGRPGLAGRSEALDLLAEAADFADKNQPRQASRSLRKSLYLDPSLAVSHYQLGLLELGEGRARQARRHWRNVVELARRQPAGETVPGWEGCSWGQLLHWTSKQLARLGKDLHV